VKSYFITGGTGFIGRELVRQLVKRDDTGLITCLTRGHRKYSELLQAEKVLYRIGDVTECEFPDYAYTDVIHGANEVNDLLQPDLPKYYYTIVEGSNRVLDWASRKGYNTLLLSSGAADRDTVYGRAKRQSEFLARHYGGVKIARIFSVLGNEMPLNGQYAAGKFIHMAMQGKVSVYGGDSMRSYLHVEDCARGLLRILEAGQPLKPYDVAGNQPISIRNLAERIAIEFEVPCEYTTAHSRKDTYVPDLRAIESLGFKQTFSLNRTLEVVCDFIRHSNK